MTHRELAKEIARKVQDPREWLLTIRMLVDLAGLDTTRMMSINSETLELACFATMDNIGKSAKATSAFQAVITKWSES